MKDNKSGTLLELYPDVAEQWHPTKNGDLTPDQVTYGSNIKIWWKCNEGPDHEWIAGINDHTRRYRKRKKEGNGCPYCRGRRVSITNSLGVNYPEIAVEWHPTKNGILTPHEIASGTHKKYWWRCNEGPDHEWEASPSNRIRGRSCPYCSGNKVSVTNSLANTYPEIAAEWHPTKNGSLKPENVTTSSNKKVWWKCSKGYDHEWLTSVGHRTGKDNRTKCPCCANQKLSITNSLGINHPEVAAEWHPTKNGALTPQNIISGTHKKYWWKCNKGPDHIWEASPGKRIEGKGCPYCSGNKVSVTNSLLINQPRIAAEWHPTKNGSLKLKNVTTGSNKRVWWKCNEGPDHEWEATISNRVARGSNCPCCAHAKLSVTNCLSTLFPKIAAQWHPTKNGQLKPNQVIAGTDRRVWWQCSNNHRHEWLASVVKRTYTGRNCPKCDLTPRSRIEIFLAHELTHFFEIDVDESNIQLPGAKRDLMVDIIIHNQKLIIEYDGSYWHQTSKKKKIDVKKTQQLIDLGWKVIRIRLDEQGRITDDDILMTDYDHEDVKTVADRLLLKLSELGYLSRKDYESYHDQDNLINADKAEAYIQQLLNAKVDQDSQLNLF